MKTTKSIRNWLAREESAETEDAFLESFVRVALWALAVIVIVATITGLVESFDGLYNWFSLHGMTGWKADYAPLMVDSFSVIGELALFAAISRKWSASRRILPWISTIIGMAASIAGNVGDQAAHSWTFMITAAIPPLAGAFGIVIGLGVLKQVGRDIVARSKANKATMDMNNVMISTQGLKELEEEPFQVSLPPLESRSTTPRGLDVLIPPRDGGETDSSLGSLVRPYTGPQHWNGVNGPEASTGIADLRPGRQLIKNETDSFRAIT